MDIKEVFNILKTSTSGLSEEEAKKRLLIYGPNELIKKRRFVWLKILFNQVKNVMVFMLLAGAIISFLIHEVIDAYTIIVILSLNILLGFIQEYKAEKALEALKSLASPQCVVIRDGIEMVIKSRDLVPGDIVVLNVGDVVPANIRLFQAINFKVDQSHLTGESIPVVKTIEPLPKDTPLVDRNNMAFVGSIVAFGKAMGVVTETGMNTEVGKIAKKISQTKKEATPLDKEINKIAKFLALSATIGVIIVFLIGIYYQHDFFKMLLTSVSLAVSSVPEGLPAVITITLAISVQKMASKNAIVKKLSAVETLGSVTVICSDKTGTITKNEMTVQKIYDGFNEYEVSGVGYGPKGKIFKGVEEANINDIKELLLAGVLCNNAIYGKKDNKYFIIGDPTEGSLLVLGAKAGIWKEDLKYKQINEISFTSERKMMSVVVEFNGKNYVYSKGAPEVIIELCKYIKKGKKKIPLTKEIKEKIKEKCNEYATNGLRLLALAYKELKNEEIETNLTFLGIVGMIDPPRPEVKNAVKIAKEAGIRILIITGDNELTATAIAKQIGLITKGSLVFTGKDIDEMPYENFQKAVASAVIFARVSPDQKYKIIKELKNQGEIIAVTGDGVNDAPALKTAHIGIAMGIKGTEVSKEAADIILADDNFSTIIHAIESGRGIYNNIKKFLKFLLSSNADTIIEVVTAIILGFPIPYLPVHILWMNLITDGTPAIALGVDSNSKNLMKRPPRDPKKTLMSEIAMFFLIAGLIDALTSIALFYITLSFEGYFITKSAYALAKARTMSISSAIIYELFFVFNCRDDDKSIWERSFKENFLSNKFLTISVIISFILQFMFIYFPPFQTIFRTASLNIVELGIVFLFALPGLFIFPKYFHKEIKFFRNL